MPTPLKLLLIEDDPLDAELNIVRLEKEGYECDWQRVQTREELVAALSKEKFDLLLVDYNLPGFDGLTALHIFAEFELDIPVIFVTGNLQAELAIDSLKAGATDFVHKDRLTRLGSTVRRALDEFALRRADKRKKAELDLFKKLNDVANKGASLQELASALSDLLPGVLQGKNTSVYLRSLEDETLIVYNAKHSLARFEQIEKILDVVVPQLSIPLNDENIYASVFREKKLRILDEPQQIQELYDLYLRIANFPPAIYKRVVALIPRIINLMGLEKVVMFPLLTGDQAIGLLEISYKDRTQGEEDIAWMQEMLGQITAIFARKRLEEEVSKLHDQQKMILDSAAEGIIGMDMEGRHIFVNPAAAEMLGYGVEELLHHQNHIQYHHSKTKNGEFDMHKCALYAMESNQAYAERQDETIFVRKDGSSFPVAFSSSKIMKDGKAVGIVVAFRDITEQVENTRALARLAQVVDQVQVSVGITDLNGDLIYLNPFFEEVSGYGRDELLGNNQRILKSGYQDDALYRELWKTITAGKPWQGKLINRHKDGSIYHEDSIIFPIKTEQGETINYASVKREISAEVEAQQRIRRQLSQLEALHLIDATILNSISLPETLDVVLEEAMKNLELDAADILVFDSAHKLFTCVSRLGFNTQALEFTSLHLGEGLAGQAALNREMVHVNDLDVLNQKAPRLVDEKFRSYYGIPLIAKGELTGVMEVFFRREFTPDDEWLSFLKAIAGQAAIAVENKQLFDDLRQKNEELRFAYEATLEGWVRGLELHDMETEGHSRRVVDMVLRLSRRMHVAEDLLAHIRRGALLHDIGKLAIPSHILNKEGPFTPDEWDLMKKHTIYAYEMLADIPFLKPALDIPYSHHEKWNGTGYPLGLKGDAIPLAARIFAIIDVYDALSFDRPYRRAWDREKVLDYLQEESGTHFDPDVVAAFFDEFVFEKDPV